MSRQALASPYGLIFGTGGNCTTVFTAEREQEMEQAAQQIMSALGEGAFTGDAHALLIAIYKNPALPLKSRLDAAEAAIGYEKPRLSSVDATLDGNIGTYAALPIPVEERDPLASTASTALNH